MARSFHSIEKGLRITGENLVAGVEILFGTGAPGGDTGEQDDAPVGSIYLDTGGSLYQKTVDNNALADWEKKGNAVIGDLSWRNETIRAASNDTLVVGNIDPLDWSDNESAIDHTDFAVGEFVVGDVDGTPALFEVTAVGVGTGNDEITLAAASQALADNDMLIVRNYLPDSPAAQEKQAILLYNGSQIIKVADFNWDIADGINLTSGYASTNGSISSSDTVDSAIRKLDGNQKDIQSASGIAQGAVNYGTFAGLSLADAQTSKQLFQRIEVLLEQMRGVQATGITAAATVDSVPHASVKSVKWLVEAFEEATPANRKAFEVSALNNGSAVDDTVYAKLKVGSNFNITLAVDIDGADMRLRATSSTAGITVTARRIEVVKSVL